MLALLFRGVKNLVGNVNITGIASGNGKFNTSDQGGAPSDDWQLVAGHFQGYITPEITYPRPDSDTPATARHRVNYTGQTYQVPIAVHGGAFPFYYELLSGPSGMTIGSQLELSGGELVAGSDYGIINYPNSVAGTYTVNVRVTDQNGVVLTRTWQLIVGTTDWVFMDPAAGVNGTGTLASPFNTLASLNGLTTKKVLIRAGTVDWEQKVVGLQSMPITYLPYGGETVLMKQALSPIGCNGGSDYSFSGFSFFIPSDRTAVSQFFRLDGGPDRVCFFNCEFDGGSFNNTETGGGEPKANSSILFWQGQAVAVGSAGNSWYSVIKNCRFKNVQDRDTYLGYSQRFTVIEGNTMENCDVGANGLGHGFYPKIDVDGFTFRMNRSVGVSNTQKLMRIDAYNINFPLQNFDVSYNSYRYYGSDGSGDGIGAISNGMEYQYAGTSRYIYRNTLYAQSAAGIHARGQDASSVITASNNVLISGGTNTNGVQLVDYQGTFNNTGYVAGGTGAGIVDVNNKLAGGYVSNLGTKGAQIA